MSQNVKSKSKSNSHEAGLLQDEVMLGFFFYIFMMYDAIDVPWFEFVQNMLSCCNFSICLRSLVHFCTASTFTS